MIGCLILVLHYQKQEIISLEYKNIDLMRGGIFPHALLFSPRKLLTSHSQSVL